MRAVSISRLHFPVTTLGPGSRIGIWFQGCSIRCHGCISADTWAAGRGQTTVTEIMRAIERWLPEANGITISGGEPFDQCEALQELLIAIKAATAANVLLYSGYKIEEISAKVSRMAGLIDALISDPYLVDAPQTLALRGSDNQRLHLLTSVGQEAFAQYQRKLTAEDRSLDLMMDGDGTVWFVGIPGREDFKRLSAALSRHNHQLMTSQDCSKETAEEKSR
ncbi:4Fe-4S single cluster domain-containing protein [Roseibium sp. Sym1]|uniref:4Fe-4S single cluster domain-containing protein n=1 Tax=Roseibium sp. Sym1 TaxID=3016006 RepID=UPI0022B34AB0|nr:4Fe-4S single cluster domain-containing protein [Roseibium sp. Sym1]